MWKKAAMLLIILSVALNLAFIGTWVTHTIGTHWVCPGPGGHAVGAGGMWCPLHQQLGASPDQWKQIEPRLVEFRKAAVALCQEVARKHTEMIDLLASPQPDREALRAKQEEILAGQRKMQELVIGQLLAEKEVLTPAQQKELFDMLRQRGGCAGHGPMLMGLGGPMDNHPAMLPSE